MPINPLPTPPTRDDPANFAQRGDAFMAALPPFAVELEAARVEVVAKEASATTAATTATTKAGEASTSATAALASKNAAALSAGAALDSQNAAATSAGTATTQAGTATTKAAEAAASAASVVRDGSGGVAGLTLFKLNLRNAANTFTSFLTNTATAARTWTTPDKDGMVAMTSDFEAPGPIGSTTPAAGSFTTLSASGAATIGNGLAVTGAMTATGALTTPAIKEVAGNVGIGQNSPYNKLSFAVGSGGAQNIGWQESGNNSIGILGSVRGWGTLVLGSRVKSSTVVSGTFVSSDGSASVPRAAICVGFNDGSIRFYTDAAATVAVDAAVTPTERLRIEVGGAVVAAGALTIGSYTLATRPAHAAGKMIYVSDGGAGAVFQGSNGSAWVNLG